MNPWRPREKRNLHATPNFSLPAGPRAGLGGCRGARAVPRLGRGMLGGRVHARPALGRALGTGLPLSASRLDGGAYRRRALRARLAAWTSARGRDRGLCAMLGYRGQRQGARRGLETNASLGQLALSAGLLAGAARGNERHRRWRKRRGARFEGRPIDLLDIAVLNAPDRARSARAGARRHAHRSRRPRSRGREKQRLARDQRPARRAG